LDISGFTSFFNETNQKIFHESGNLITYFETIAQGNEKIKVEFHATGMRLKIQDFSLSETTLSRKMRELSLPNMSLADYLTNLEARLGQTGIWIELKNLRSDPNQTVAVLDISSKELEKVYSANA
jgi:hypothetical protein